VPEAALWARGHALLTEGRLPEAAREFGKRLAAAGSSYTIQLFVACAPETIRRAVARTGVGELYVRAARYQEKDCYALGWGIYPSEAEARAAAKRVPGYFLGNGLRPRVVPVARLLP
jgi:hypothetical protein